MSEAKLIEIINKSGLDQAQSKPLLDSFGDFFLQAHKIVAKSKAIKVTSEDQIEEMSRARELRLELKKIRVEADKTRATLKEGYLRGGNAVQSIYNDIRDIVKPEEDRLEAQEKYAEILQEKRKAEKIQKRTEELSKYVEDVSIYNVSTLSTETFDKLLADSKRTYEEKIEAEKKAEKERAEAEKKRLEDEARIRKENEDLRKKQEEQDAAIKKEREEKEKLERELQEKKAAEEQAKRDEEERILKEKEAAEEAKRQADLAPDKDKMRAFYKKLATLRDEISLIQLESEGAKAVAQSSYKEINAILENMAERMKKL